MAVVSSLCQQPNQHFPTLKQVGLYIPAQRSLSSVASPFRPIIQADAGEERRLSVDSTGSEHNATGPNNTSAVRIGNVSVSKGSTPALSSVPSSYSSQGSVGPPRLTLSELPRNTQSKLLQLTSNICEFYTACNSQFVYDRRRNPRRVLTSPAQPVHNDGLDNCNNELILRVNDELGVNHPSTYQVLSLLGTGAFGQVVRAVNMRTRDICAVKVIKNQQAYFNQALLEIRILKDLQTKYGDNPSCRIVRLRDYFVHANHLCLCFELLHVNLYELLKSNAFRGLSLTVIHVFLKQLLESLAVLADEHIIHCDLKPENILLVDSSSANIKVIDFGSACHENRTVYTYIQSRYYRAPEVLLHYFYNSAIDIWSLGCILAELFLGLPLFPGASDYHQLARVFEMCDYPPREVLERGKATLKYFSRLDSPLAPSPTCTSPSILGTSPQSNESEPPHSAHEDHHDEAPSVTKTPDRRKTVAVPSPTVFPVSPCGQFQFKTEAEFCKENGVEPIKWKRYFNYTQLEELIKHVPYREHPEQEKVERVKFADLLRGLLHTNPRERWTAKQTLRHPFVTGEEFKGPGVFHQEVVQENQERIDREERRLAEMRHNAQKAAQAAAYAMHGYGTPHGHPGGIPIPTTAAQPAGLPFPSSWEYNHGTPPWPVPGTASPPSPSMQFAASAQHGQQQQQQQQQHYQTPPQLRAFAQQSQFQNYPPAFASYQSSHSPPQSFGRGGYATSAAAAMARGNYGTVAVGSWGAPQHQHQHQQHQHQHQHQHHARERARTWQSGIGPPPPAHQSYSGGPNQRGGGRFGGRHNTSQAHKPGRKRNPSMHNTPTNSPGNIPWAGGQSFGYEIPLPGSYNPSSHMELQASNAYLPQSVAATGTPQSPSRSSSPELQQAADDAAWDPWFNEEVQ